MKDRKALFLLIFALIMVTISFVLISIWGYHFYYAGKNKQAVPKGKPPARKTEKFSIPDSVLSIVKDFNQGGKDENDSIEIPVDTELASRIVEFNRLKNEIAEILRKRSSTHEISEANEKISQLQESVEALKNKNDTIIRENERLTQMIKNLAEKKKNAAVTTKSGSKHIAKSAASLPVLVSHLRFLAYSLNDEKKETNIASKTERLYGSFQINIKSYNTNNFIYVVVIQPNGKTLLNPAAVSNTFETHDGKKVYSALIRLDNKKDNGFRLGFSIDSPNFQKGKYTMQIYHQGLMIGRLTRTLF